MIRGNEAKASSTTCGESGNKMSSENPREIKSSTTAAAVHAVQIPAARNQRSPRSGRKGVPTFPEKLHAILNDNRLSSIITWLPSGKSFCILNKDAFTRNVLPRYFKESLFESFSRRLKRWGYRKVYTTGQKQIVLTHDLFQKGRLDLCKMMNGRASQSSEVTGKGASSETTKIDESMIEELALAEKSLRAHRNVNGTSERKTEMAPQVNRLPQVSPRTPPAQAATMYPQAAAAPHVIPHLNHGTVSFQRHREVGSFRAPHNLMHAAGVARQMSSLDEEIRECEEQLAILNRLRALRERRQSFF